METPIEEGLRQPSPPTPRTLKPHREFKVIKKRLKRPDMTWHDHLIMLLNLGAEIEHALMVQYLYAAWSLGGEHIAPQYRPKIHEWQETILAVAREEMGHLLTVQNILTLLGAQINLQRQDFPWDIEYYPFPFVLEPLSLGSLACYVFAEMPAHPAPHEDFLPGERDRIRKLATEHARKTGLKKDMKLHEVGEIYTQIIDLIGNGDRIPDSSFHEESISVQASWDDWGRRYAPAPRHLNVEGNLEGPPPEIVAAGQFRSHLLIDRVATRTEAVATLTKLSAQGEGPHSTKSDAEWSHFSRFIKIFREFEQILAETKNPAWSPARRIVTNPNTLDNPGAPDRSSFISAKRTQNWAHLFNTRYRLLLNYLSHTFRQARVTRSDEPSVRAVLMHRVFCEMYNLKTIAGILVQLPLSDNGDGVCAGPPFEMPYSLTLPPAEVDTWHLHFDVLGSAGNICHRILAQQPHREERAYIETLLDLDDQFRVSINAILTGLGETERAPA